jgi:hypothetical protein
MSRSLPTASTTMRPDDHSHETSQHDHATTDPPASNERLKIKNFTAHPRITIRRGSRTPGRGRHKPISKWRAVDLEERTQPC